MNEGQLVVTINTVLRTGPDTWEPSVRTLLVDRETTIGEIVNWTGYNLKQSVNIAIGVAATPEEEQKGGGE